MTDPRFLGIKGTILRETKKALYLSLTNGRQEWFPKSTITSAFTSNQSETQNFVIAKWILEKKGLIRESKNVNIIGRSGSEDYLKHRLLRKGLDGFNSIKDIQYFKSNFSKILKSSTVEERKKLNKVIADLKNKEENLNKRLEEKKLELEQSLIKEKSDLMDNPIDSKAKKKIKKIDKTLVKKLDKPFKKDIKQIKKTEKEQIKREKNLDKTVEKKVSDLHKTQDIIQKNQPFFSGAIGETAVIKELSKLPEAYHILNEVMLSFSKSIRWKKYNDYVKTCKIDHVVVGPTGIFLIETKNWSAQTMLNAKFTPHKQIDRAGYVFFIHMMDQFGRKFPVYHIVATYRQLPQIPYDFVTQLTIRELVDHILIRQGRINPSDILTLVSWLRSSPHISNSKLKFRLF